MPTCNEQIVACFLNIKYEDIQSEPLDEVRKASSDCIVLTLTGAKDPADQTLANWARKVSGKPQSFLVRNGISLINLIINNCEPLTHSRKHSY